MDFSKSTVWVDVKHDSKTIIFQISDDGKGFPVHFLDRLGEPFLIEKVEEKLFDISRPHYRGMGLGVGIAKTLLEHLGGVVSFSNNNSRVRKDEWLEKDANNSVKGMGAIATIQFNNGYL